MAGTTQRKPLSLDANLVFDLARDKDFAHEFIEVFRAKGYSFLLPPTAVYELNVIRAQGNSTVERELRASWPASFLLKRKPSISGLATAPI